MVFIFIFFQIFFVNSPNTNSKSNKDALSSGPLGAVSPVRPSAKKGPPRKF